LLVLVAAGAPFLSAGCAHKTVQAAVPVSAPPVADVRPMTVAPDTDANPPLEAEQAAPSLPAPSAKAPMNLADSAVVPPPRRPVERSTESAEQDTAARPEPPRISPELSPSDQAAYQKRIESDSAVATRNLQIVSARQLNPTQSDLADKIRSYLSQAGDAGKSGDWVRAQNLAHKAASLSVDLIESL